jgi:hypothetical protein
MPLEDDAVKKINGRKRQLLVDMVGLVLTAKVHAANIANREGAYLLLEPLPGAFTRLRQLWADMGDRGQGLVVCQNSYTPGKAGGMIMNRPRRFTPT